MAVSGRLRAILFDLDGTLLDSVPLIVASYRHTLATHGLPVPSDNALRSAIGPPLDVHFARWVDDPAEVQAMIATYRRYNLAVHDQMVAGFPGVSEALEHLAEARLGIVTGKLRDDAVRGLRCLGLEDRFEVLVCREDTLQPKPDPEPIRHALDLLGLEAGAVAYVGDTVGDVEAGLAAGVFTIAVTWGVAEASSLRAAGPDVVVHDVAELLAALSHRSPS